MSERTKAEVEEEINSVNHRLVSLQLELAHLTPAQTQTQTQLSLEEYKRYGRQLILPSLGLPGQLVLRQSHVLIIGVGGLGCPVLLYLAASGIGEITILDHDKVELSNLGRQILHTEQGARDGLSKVASGKRAVKALNSNVKVNAYQVAFTPELFSPSPNDGLASIFNEDPKFDLILDCTDNPATRHLINAYSVKWGIPLVSGGAVRADGVVGVYGLDLKGKGEERQDGEEEKGPCYACVFPPTASTCSSEARGTESQEARERREEQEALLGTGSCSDEGVLGVLCGTVGLGMAGEALKVLLGKAKPTLHLLSPLSLSTPYRTIKLRPRSPNCPVCSTSSPSSSFANLCENWQNPLCQLPGIGDLNQFDSTRVDVQFLKEEVRKGKVRVIDVRSETEFGICKIDGSENVPLSKFLKDLSSAISQSVQIDEPTPIYIVCRRGNDSYIAARALRRAILAKEGASTSDRIIADVKGGLVAWSRELDGEFPVY